MNSQVISTTRNSTCSHIWLMFPIQYLIGPSTPAPTAQPPVPPHCGQIYCAYHVSISELPWDPLTAQHRTAEVRAGNNELFWPPQPQCTCRKVPGRPHPFLWMAHLLGGLDWPVSLTTLQGWSVLLLQGQSFFQILGVIFTPLALLPAL